MLVNNIRQVRRIEHEGGEVSLTLKEKEPIQNITPMPESYLKPFNKNFLTHSNSPPVFISLHCLTLFCWLAW